MCVCVCVCACACVRVCVCACVRAYVRVCNRDLEKARAHTNALPSFSHTNTFRIVHLAQLSLAFFSPGTTRRRSCAD